MANEMFEFTLYEMQEAEERITKLSSFETNKKAKKWMLNAAYVLRVGIVMLRKVDAYLADPSDAEAFSIEMLEHSKATNAPSTNLIRAIELLKTAECTGSTYVDLDARSKWKKERDQLIATTYE